MDVSEANFLVSEANITVSEASKLSAGARIFRGPQGPEILVKLKVTDSEVIWSWDGFSKGYRDRKFGFTQTSDDTEMRNQFDIKTNAFYPVVFFYVCNIGEGGESSFEILGSKLGQDGTEQEL